ncbi:MAG: helix-hairpin-helix domain-containing protein [Chitinophagaceae bacterium]|nr:helix-hairpin-helix domain-containing protein [Chitinophagaceae bacterium]
MKANQWKEYFVFSKKERIGIITMLIILIGIWFLPAAFSPDDQTDNQKLEAFRAQIAALKIKDTAASNNIDTYVENGNTPIVSLFYFDPNTLSFSGWKKLGLPDKTIATITNYISKGGKFRKPEDLAKIYGLRKTDYERLAPYVKIENLYHKEGKLPIAELPLQHEQKTIKAIDINSADTTIFIALPGIGSKLANRIINFRQKLGGFYAVDQVAEVYGLPDSTFQKIRPKLLCNAKDIHKININTTTLDDLKAHPYIKFQVANAVIQYRNQHGNFQSLNDLKYIPLINDEVFQKMVPYLTLY